MFLLRPMTGKDGEIEDGARGATGNELLKSGRLMLLGSIEVG